MNSIDLAILAILVLFAYSGFRAGIMNKLFSIAGIILGLVLAVKYVGAAANILVFVTSIKGGGIRGPLTYAVAFLMTFIIVVISVKVIYFMLAKERKVHSLAQRVSGSVAGFIEGGVFLSIVLVWLNTASFPTEYQKQNSILYKPALNFAPRLFDEIALGLPQSKGFYDEMSKHLDIERYFKR